MKTQPAVNYLNVYFYSSGLVGIHNPPIDRIGKIINTIGYGQKNDLKLHVNFSEDLGEIHYLKIFGEKNLYSISEWECGYETNIYEDILVPHEKKIYLPGFDFPFQSRQFCKDIKQTVEIAEYFYMTGKVLPSADWF